MPFAKWRNKAAALEQAIAAAACLAVDGGDAAMAAASSRQSEAATLLTTFLLPLECIARARTRNFSRAHARIKSTRATQQLQARAQFAGTTMYSGGGGYIGRFCTIAPPKLAVSLRNLSLNVDLTVGTFSQLILPCPAADLLYAAEHLAASTFSTFIQVRKEAHAKAASSNMQIEQKKKRFLFLRSAFAPRRIATPMCS